ncbi:MAG: DUF4166 domain-containing protein [Burkholderiales bacterium]
MTLATGEHCMYARAMGRTFRALPWAVKEAHADRPARVLIGRATVRRGPSAIARLIGWAYSFPPASQESPCRVEFSTTNRGEHWWRRFDGHSMRSTLIVENGRLFECFGVLKCELDCAKRGTKLVIRSTGRAWFAGIPVPRWFAPDVIASEAERAGRFVFRVHIRIPAFGLIAAYRGNLSPAGA